MNPDVNFRRYLASDQQACLSIFDSNCPDYFAPNEKDQYQEFLESSPASYELCISSGQVVGAFGVFDRDSESKNLNWILLDPSSQGLGLGSIIMARVSEVASSSGAKILHIAASHKSAPFFLKFGAMEKKLTAHGWGDDMHRVDMELRL